ncbi:hypothetical protein ACQY0O_000598 [Thecaphora frezii]
MSPTSSHFDDNDDAESVRTRLQSHDNTIEFFERMCDFCLKVGSKHCGVDRRLRPKGINCDTCANKKQSCRIRGKPVYVKPARRRPPSENRIVPPDATRLARIAAEKRLAQTQQCQMSDAYSGTFIESEAPPSSDDDEDVNSEAPSAAWRDRALFRHLETLLNDLQQPIRFAKSASSNRSLQRERKAKIYKNALRSIEGRMRMEAARFGIELGKANHRTRTQAHRKQ